MDESKPSTASKDRVDQSNLARPYFRNGDAIGSQIRCAELKGGHSFHWRWPGATVGSSRSIVSDDAHDGLRQSHKPALYVDYTI